jgi:outer membrane protein assembly factor BamB
MRASQFPRTLLVLVTIGALAVATPGPVRASTGNADPAQLWVSTYNGAGDAGDTARVVGVSPDGATLFVTGGSDGGLGRGTDYATVAYDAVAGRQLWSSRYDGDGGYDQPYALEVSADGAAVYVTGESFGGPSRDDYATVAYEAATGKELWTARFVPRTRGYDAALAIGVNPDGSRVFVTGYASRPGTANSDYATVAYDAATGEQVWTARYGTAPAADYAYALQVSPDGSTVFITGQSDYDDATVAYDASTGSQLWVSRYDGPAHDVDAAYAIATTPDGSSVIVSGYTVTGDTETDFGTIAYDAATGERRWVATFNGPRDQIDGAFALEVSPDGSAVFVTGTSSQLENGLDADYATVAYDTATGGQLWQALFKGAGGQRDDIPYAIAINPDGSAVYVTGWTTDPRRGGNYDFGTVAYDATTGATLWVQRLHTAFDDVGYDVAVSPDGSKIFVTGGVGRGVDYGTVAYST